MRLKSARVTQAPSSILDIIGGGGLPILNTDKDRVGVSSKLHSPQPYKFGFPVCSHEQNVRSRGVSSTLALYITLTLLTFSSKRALRTSVYESPVAVGESVPRLSSYMPTHCHYIE